MIAVDTSSLVAFLKGDVGADISALQEALKLKLVVIPPVVVSEITSAKNLPKELLEFLQSIQQLEILDNYWINVGKLRRSILAMGRKAPLSDSLIAQSCIDHQAPLITRDSDFRNFTKFGLKLVNKF